MKVYGKRSSRKPTSLENLFRTRPADRVRHWITDRLTHRDKKHTDRPTRQTRPQTDEKTVHTTDTLQTAGRPQTDR